MTAEFYVEITMNKLNFVIEANNDAEAIDMALDKAHDLTPYDLLDGAITSVS